MIFFLILYKKTSKFNLNFFLLKNIENSIFDVFLKIEEIHGLLCAIFHLSDNDVIGRYASFTATIIVSLPLNNRANLYYSSLGFPPSKVDFEYRFIWNTLYK